MGLYKGIGESFLKKITRDTAFVMENLESVLGKLENSNKDGEVSDDEIAECREFMNAVKVAVEKDKENANEMEEDVEGELCNICYTFVIDRVFEPCQHTSCDQCISRHLLNDP